MPWNTMEYGKIEMVEPPPAQSGGSYNPFFVRKMTDTSSPTFDQPVPTPSAFDAYADPHLAKAGTSLASVTDMIIDPFNPGAAFGDGSVRFAHDPVVPYGGGALPVNIQAADLNLFKPLFAFTSFDLV